MTISKHVALARSVEGRTISAHVFSRRARGGLTVVILGGFHGDEPKSVTVVRRLAELLGESPELRGSTRWVIAPLINPDGYSRRRRRNARNVDINRNFPTDDWTQTSRRSRMYGGPKAASEPETRAVMKIIEQYRPARIVTIHSIGLGRFCNNFDGPGKRLAAAMRRRNGYPVAGSIGYPTPGSFGNWAGYELHIPTITLELPSLDSAKRCWEDNREALLRVGGT